MVKIRLARRGAKKNPFYSVVIADSRRAATARVIERVGYYNPMARGAETVLHINQERISYWLANGAKASDRCSSLIKKHQQQIAANDDITNQEDTTVTEDTIESEPTSVEDKKTTKKAVAKKTATKKTATTTKSTTAKAPTTKKTTARSKEKTVATKSEPKPSADKKSSA